MGNCAYLVLLLFTILCKLNTGTTAGSNWSTNSSGIKLLGLFPQQTEGQSEKDMWVIHCRYMFRAAIILSQRYNIKLQGQVLTYGEITTGDDPMIIVDQICQKVPTSNIYGFVGPAYSSEARYLASFSHRLGISSVSYSATSPDLSNIDNGAFFRVVPSDENAASSIIALFRQYAWKSCIVIYQNDEYGYDGMKLLTQKFREMNIRYLDIIKFDMSQQTFYVDLKRMLLDNPSRIIIVWANENSTITILNRALQESLIGSDFVWILMTNVALNTFNQIQKKKLIGILTIEPVQGDFVDARINRTLLDQAYEIWKSYEEDSFPGSANVSSYALFTFDATWSLILSLQKLCSQEVSCLDFQNSSNCFDHRYIHSKQLYDIIKNTAFLGVSGEVKFVNGTPNRIGDIYYIIKNIQSLKIDKSSIDYVHILKWYVGFDKWLDYRNDSDGILWPNESKDIPVDHKIIRGKQTCAS